MRKFKKSILMALAVFLTMNAWAGGSSSKLNYENYESRRLNSMNALEEKEQFSIGGGLFYHLYGGGTGLKFFGLNLIGEYSAENYSFRGSFNYNFPKTSSGEVEGYALSSVTVPSYHTATSNTKVTILTLAADAKYLFGSDADYTTGGLYGFGGLGLSFAGLTTTLENTNSDYDYGVSDEKEVFTQFLFRLGLGYDYRMDFGSIFGEGILSIPMNKVNGEFVEITIPTSYGFQFGVRFPLSQ